MSTEQQCPGIIGSDTEVEINFDYSPKELKTLDDPGCDATVEISSIVNFNYKGPYKTPTLDNIMDNLSQETIDAFEVKCHEYMDNPERDE